MPEDTFRWVITGAVAISTLCIAIMAIAGVAIFRVVSKLQVKALEIANRVEPIIDTVRKLAQTNAPNITSVAQSAALTAKNVKDMSDVARDQAHRYAELGRDLADRAKAQVARVDAALDDTVDQVQTAGEQMKSAVLKPVKEASGIFAGVKAAVSTYAANASSGRRPMGRATQDEEMFI